MKYITSNLQWTLSKYIFNNSYKCYNHFNSRNYNILFFGSDNISLKSLQKVNEFKKKENTVKRLDLVTTNKLKNKLTKVEQYAQSEKIPILTWPLDIIKGEYDIGILVAFGHLIKKDNLQKFPLGIINMHPSLLPRWRGSAPIIYTLLHGDELTGVSIMRIKPDIFDVGDIVMQKRIPISKDIKLDELTNQLSEFGADLLVECLKTLPSSLENSLPQSKEGVTYAKKIQKNISEVRWTEMTARDVYNLYRAIYGIYDLKTTFRNREMKLFSPFLKDDTAEEIYGPEKILVGSIDYCRKTDAVRVLCKDRRYIYFKSLRIIGKREITAIDFYNGYIKNRKVSNEEDINNNVQRSKNNNVVIC